MRYHGLPWRLTNRVSPTPPSPNAHVLRRRQQPEPRVYALYLGRCKRACGVDVDDGGDPCQSEHFG